MDVLVFLASVLLLVLSLTPSMRFPGKEIDLPSHFSLQYLIGACILFFFAGAFEAKAPAYLCLAAAFFASLRQMMRYLPLGRPFFMDEGIEPLKILQANVLKLNTDASRLRKLIQHEKPDIVIAAEVRNVFAELFVDLSDEYPYQRIEADEKTSYGMAVMSKLPFTQCETISLDRPENRAIAFRLRYEGQDIDFLSLHPATPNRDIDSRDREFANAVKRYKGNSEYLVVAGDLNATPYCTAYKKFSKGLGLRNARESFGLNGTFPVFLPFSWLRIPIDHVMAGKGLRVEDFRLGPNIGSDHLPTITSIGLAAPDARY